MNPQDAIDFSREAIMTCMKVGGPILVAGLLIGLLVGVFQAMTQVQDQTVSFVPKILLLLTMIGLCLPWLSDQMLDFAKQAFEKPMTHWNGNQQALVDYPTPTSNSNERPYIDNPAVESRTIESEIRRSMTIPSNTASVTAPIQSSTPVKKASFVREREQVPQTNAVSIEPVSVERVQPPEPTESPFILPHYRFSKVPKTDIDG